MVIQFLPEEVFGMDIDDVLAYTTPKVTLIRDRYVGSAYYCLMVLAMCWVIIGQILWRNEHFMRKDVKGTTRMFISHPTRNQCDPNEADCLADFKSLSQISYCRQHEGGSQVAHPADCVFADKHSIFIDGTVGGQVFIPTSEMVIEETKGCQPSASNKHSCSNEYRKKTTDDSYYFNETKMKYYANIEDYTVQFTSTYHREDISGTSLDHPGYYDECYDDIGKLGGDHVTWKERLDARSVCKKQKRRAVECMPGMECEKGGLHTIKVGNNLDLGKGFKKVGKRLEKNTKQIDRDVNETFNKVDKDVKKGFRIKGDDDESASLISLGSSRLARTKRTSRRHKAASRGPGKDDQAEDDEDEDEDDDEEEAYRPTPDVYASTWGDTFKLGKLFQLANLDLDKHFNMDDYSARMAGTIIEVEATYSNLQPFLSSFGRSLAKYTYRVRERKLPYVSKEALHPDQPEDYPNSRRYLVQHGILLDFKVGGEFGFFSIVYLLIMLTTSMALLATAHKITDLFSLYLHPRNENYFHLKYDVSADFSDMWSCSKCGYFNLATSDKCKGIEKWKSKHDSEFCGAPRPGSFRRASVIKAEGIDRV